MVIDAQAKNPAASAGTLHAPVRAGHGELGIEVSFEI
jgi:hypothetical protein